MSFKDEHGNIVKAGNVLREIYEESCKQSNALQTFSSDLALKLRDMSKCVYLYQRSPSQKWSEVNDDQIEFTVNCIIERIMKGKSLG